MSGPEATVEEKTEPATDGPGSDETAAEAEAAHEAGDTAEGTGLGDGDGGDDAPDAPDGHAPDAPDGHAPDATDGHDAPDATPGDDGQTTVGEDLPPLVAVLEAALFASAEPIPLARLTRVLGAWTRKQVVAGLEELEARQVREGSGIRLVETAGGYQLRSVSDYAPWVRRFFAEKPPRLSRAVLETLAIVGYRQPVTRGEIESVRGVNCDAVLGSLTARGLIQIVGRRQSPGRPVEYGTTREFLELFSLRDLAELPPLPDPSSLASLIEEARAQDEEDAALATGDESDETGEDIHADEDGSNGSTETDGGAAPEDPEPGRSRFAPIGGVADPGGSGPREREGDPGAGGEG